LATAHRQKNKEIAQVHKVILDSVNPKRNRWIKLQSISLGWLAALGVAGNCFYRLRLVSADNCCGIAKIETCTWNLKGSIYF
jgi:hypothetical protein